MKQLTGDTAEENGEKTDSLTNRYFYAGLGTNFGEFSYGKQDSPQVIIDITDTIHLVLMLLMPLMVTKIVRITSFTLVSLTR